MTARPGRTLLLIALALAVPATSFAQTFEENRRQENLATTHSVLQKTGLGTLAATGALGFALMANHETLFGDGLCKDDGSGIFGEFGCSKGLTLVHFGFAVTTLGLFIAQEIAAEEMNPRPYDVGSDSRRHTMEGLRWTNVGLFALQPVLGVIAANPGIIGIPTESRPMFSRVMRTVHFGVGLGLATTYTVNAALQW